MRPETCSSKNDVGDNAFIRNGNLIFKAPFPISLARQEHIYANFAGNVNMFHCGVSIVDNGEWLQVITVFAGGNMNDDFKPGDLLELVTNDNGLQPGSGLDNMWE